MYLASIGRALALLLYWNRVWIATVNMAFTAGPRNNVGRFLECCGLVVFFLVVLAASHYENSPDTSTADSRHDQYGVDVSFPIHHSVSKFQDTNSVYAQRYRKTMEGCYKAYSKGECDATERARIDMCLTQPRSQHNYTEVGFKKMKVPSLIWGEILRFWEENKEREIEEDWPPGNTYVNNWERYANDPNIPSLFLTSPLTSSPIFCHTLRISIGIVLPSWYHLKMHNYGVVWT